VVGRAVYGPRMRNASLRLRGTRGRGRGRGRTFYRRARSITAFVLSRCSFNRPALRNLPNQAASRVSFETQGPAAFAEATARQRGAGGQRASRPSVVSSPWSVVGCRGAGDRDRSSGSCVVPPYALCLAP
jgi:hypothetical protein